MAQYKSGEAAGTYDNLTVAENLEASLDLAREVLMKDSGDLVWTEALLERYRRDYYKHIDTEADDEARRGDLLLLLLETRVADPSRLC